MKKILVLVLAAAMLMALAACAEKEPGHDGAKAVLPEIPVQEDGTPVAEADITGDILATFEELAKIPRPSHHEERISSYLKSWAEAQGFDVVQDEERNLIINVPATEGFEDRPVVALQGHMDMVFAQNPGAGLDPLNTEIRVVNDGSFLRSDGSTSLGADDGIGTAILMNIAEGKMEHGPLRLIITTNEEDGMSGVFGLDPACVRDIAYLINLDNEQEGATCLSTAAGIKVCFDDVNHSAVPTLDTALQLNISGLAGGHSGVDIDKGRLNAAIAAAELLQGLKSEGIAFELASLTGGTAANAIPSYAEAVFCVDGSDAETAKNLLTATAQQLQADYAVTEPDMSFTVQEAALPEAVLTAEDCGRALGLITEITNGVYTMSADVEGLVESSSNLGVVTVSTEQLAAMTYIRSSSPDMLAVLTDGQTALGDALSIACTVEKTADPWPFKTDNTLYRTAAEAYRTLFNAELEPQCLHAGLECGTFYIYNREINMISIGPTIHEPHSVNECLEIETIGKVWNLVQEILRTVE